MSAATAPITDVSRTGPEDSGDIRKNQKITSKSVGVDSSEEEEALADLCAPVLFIY